MLFSDANYDRWPLNPHKTQKRKQQLQEAAASAASHAVYFIFTCCFRVRCKVWLLTPFTLTFNEDVHVFSSKYICETTHTKGIFTSMLLSWYLWTNKAALGKYFTRCQGCQACPFKTVYKVPRLPRLPLQDRLPGAGLPLPRCPLYSSLRFPPIHLLHHLHHYPHSPGWVSDQHHFKSVWWR